MLNKKIKPIVYIDGQNFMFKTSDVLVAKGIIKTKDDIQKMDIRHLLKQIIDDQDPVVRYYGAKLKIFEKTADLKEKTEKIVNNQRILRSYLSKQNIEFISSGKLKLRDGDICKKCGAQDMHLQEKGVDVSIAADMVAEGTKGRTIYLVSSDTDLLPAVVKAKNAGANVIYVGMSGHRANALVNLASSVIIIRDKELIQSFSMANNSKTHANKGDNRKNK